MNNWKETFIGKITNNLDNKRVPLNETQRNEIRGNGSYPYFGANNELDRIDKFIFDEKIICIAEDGGSWGFKEKCSYIVDEKCWVNNHAHVLTAKSELSLEYLKYYLNFTDLTKFITGTTRGKLTRGALERIKIPLPPLPEQKRIAEVLDCADALREKRRLALQKLDTLLQSVFLEMFGDPVKNPMGWEIRNLEDLTSKITDGVHLKPTYTDEGVPFISVKDITTGKLYFDDCKFISKEDHESYSRRCNVEYHDILYTKVGATYGRAVIVDTEKEFSLYVSVALLKPKKEIINPLFLEAVMNSIGIKRQADRSIKGIGVPDLHLIEIKNFLIPVPSMEIQDDFVKKVNFIRNLINQQKNQLEKSNELFQSLQQRAFKGELFDDKVSYKGV